MEFDFLPVNSACRRIRMYKPDSKHCDINALVIYKKYMETHPCLALSMLVSRYHTKTIFPWRKQCPLTVCAGAYCKYTHRTLSHNRSHNSVLLASVQWYMMGLPFFYCMESCSRPAIPYRGFQVNMYAFILNNIGVYA